MEAIINWTFSPTSKMSIDPLQTRKTRMIYTVVKSQRGDDWDVEIRRESDGTCRSIVTFSSVDLDAKKMAESYAQTCTAISGFIAANPNWTFADLSQ